MLITVTVVVLATSSALAACSSEPLPEMTPAEATENLSQRLFLSTVATDCIRKILDAKPELASALNSDSDKQPSKARLDEFVTAVRPCLPAQVLADAYAKIAPTGASVDEGQISCIRYTVLTLDEPSRDQLILLASGASGADPVELGKPIAQITQKCKVAVPVGLPGASDTLPPGGGATMITRGT